MFLVILRQQYGDRMWSYRDLPYLFEEARRNGVNTLALFGWTEAGHDSHYPIYRPDPEMGAEQALREGLAAVSKAGDNTILYINGHISAFLSNFSRKVFAPLCSGDPEWEKAMRDVGRQLLAYGPSGVIYDQVGGMPAYPCFGNSRGERESESHSARGLRFLTAVRENLQAARPDAGLMGEHFTDVETVRREEKVHLRDYLRKVSQLRDRYWDLLAGGTFRDDRGIANRNPALTVTHFARGQRSAVVVWNNTAKAQAIDFDLAGKRFVEGAGVDGPLPARPRSLAPQEVAVLLYE